jgi:hypothetical protein
MEAALMTGAKVTTLREVSSGGKIFPAGTEAKVMVVGGKRVVIQLDEEGGCGCTLNHARVEPSDVKLVD